MPANSPELDPAEHGITALAVSPNGQIAAVGGSSGKVKLISMAKGDVLATRLVGHAEGESVEALLFVDLLNGAAGGNKGVVLVSAGTDGKAFVWDVATGRVRAELQHDVRLSPLFFLSCPHPVSNITLCRNPSPPSPGTPIPNFILLPPPLPTPLSRHGTSVLGRSSQPTLVIWVSSTVLMSRLEEKARSSSVPVMRVLA